MGTAKDLLNAARADIGLSGRPNKITRDYASRHGNAFLTAPWCNMAVTYWARKSGTAKAVLPGGDRAYTVWHAQDFQKIGRWYSGTVENVNRAKPGDIVFFDWGGTNSIGAIDHVGIVEKVLGGGRVQTIEGNTGDAVRRRVRSAGEIAGYGRPDFAGTGKPSSSSKNSGSSSKGNGAKKAPAWPGVYLKYPPYTRHSSVRTWQARMKERGWRIDVDGVYGPQSKTVCTQFQREKRLLVDGIVGPQTWKATWEAPIT